jgi:chorismate synthase
MNSFGNIFRLTSFGESHGKAIGGVIDGVPSGCILSLTQLQQALDARRPGSSANVTPRREADRLHVLSGVMALDANNQPGALQPDSDRVVTLGTPIGFYVENTDSKPGAYDNVRNLYRPNHADFTYQQKYGIRDWRGGGRSSGRETISRVVVGGIAAQLLSKIGVEIQAEISEVGGVADPAQFNQLLTEARNQGNSLGGIVSCRISGVPVGLGEPTFGKLQQMLASAMLSIGGVHGFEYGDGFRLAAMRGSQAADQMTASGFSSNHCGGILGGISNGQEITMRVAFKPTPSIAQPLQTINVDGNAVEVCTIGRHDPCIAIRGVHVVKAMAAIVIYDAYLMNCRPTN